MVQTNKKENQHYVPQMLLRNFAIAGVKQKQVHVFDKHSQRMFRTSVRNITAEYDFYDFEHDGKSISLEPLFSELEGYAAAAIKKLIDARSVEALDGPDRDWLSIFVAAQQIRVKNYREMVKQTFEVMAEKLKASGADSSEVDEMMLPEEMKRFSAVMFGQSIRQFSELVLNKDWLLFETTSDDPFIVGDNPVTLHNLNTYAPYGNLGLALAGIQIHLPISPTLCLAMWCPTVMSDMCDQIKDHEKKIADIERLLARGGVAPGFDAKTVIKNGKTAMSKARATIEAFEKGTAIQCSNENVMFMNSKQIEWAEQYVMSTIDDFTLAKRMLEDNDRFKHGIRFQMG